MSRFTNVSFEEDRRALYIAETHRITLWREDRFHWRPAGEHFLRLSLEGPSNPFVMFVGLNPSKATDVLDDPTIRKCVKFARTWGFKALVMCNAYGWRATKPADLFDAKARGENIIGGSLNDWVIEELSGKAGKIIAAWGQNIEPARQAELLAMLPKSRLYALAVNKDHTPKHPLYCRDDTQPLPFALPATGRMAAISQAFTAQLHQARNQRRP